MDHFPKEYETQEADAAAAFYRYISGMSGAVLVQGHVFKKQLFNYLDRIDAQHNVPIRGLTYPGQMMWTYCGPIPHFNFTQRLDFINEITKAVWDRKPLHLVPLACNFPAVDSILYDPIEVLTCIQTMISGNPGIRVPGLRRIQSWLECDTPLATLRPSEHQPRRFTFVVPSGEETFFELQRLEGDHR